jgi:hypothetical protein
MRKGKAVIAEPLYRRLGRQASRRQDLGMALRTDEQFEILAHVEGAYGKKIEK